jgi:shikimate kinase
LVISCGGGVILNKNNILNLKANGLIIYLTRDEKDLVFSTNRPLTKNIEEYLSLKKEREMLYNLYKDYEVKNSSIEECSNKIKEVFYESINY